MLTKRSPKYYEFPHLKCLIWYMVSSGIETYFKSWWRENTAMAEKVISIGFCAFRYSDSHFDIPSEFISEARKSFSSLPSLPWWLVIIIVGLLVMLHGHEGVTVFKELSSGDKYVVMQNSVLRAPLLWLLKVLRICTHPLGCVSDVTRELTWNSNQDYVFSEHRNWWWKGAAQHSCAGFGCYACLITLFLFTGTPEPLVKRLKVPGCIPS